MATHVNLIRTQPVQPSFEKTYLLFGLKNRRDSIIALVEQRHSGEPFGPPFADHMKKIGKKSLDEYSKIIIHILEYNIHLTFVTSDFVENALEYTIESLSAEPDYRFRRAKTFLEWLTGPKS
jgi:hypothetical protein